MNLGKNTSKYFDVITKAMEECCETKPNSKESKLVGEALYSTIFDLDTPRAANLNHTPQELFIANTLFRPFSEIIDTMEIIELIPTLISNFPFKRHGISKTRYLQYHVGNYIVETGKLRDSLIGYSGKIKNAYRNSHDCSNGVETSLKELKKYITKSFTNMTKTRDAHIHELRYSDRDIDRVSLLELLCLNEDTHFKHLYELAYKNTRKFWANFIRKEISTMEVILDSYFEQLIKLVTIQERVKYPNTL